MSKHETRSAGKKSRAVSVEHRNGRKPRGLVPVQGDVGFVGLGHMGMAMAANLATAGRRVIAYVRRPEQMAKLVALGLKPTTDIAGLFDCEFVISMLPDDSAVHDVVFGRQDLGVDGLAAGLEPGVVHLSMSTISTATAARRRLGHMQLSRRAGEAAVVRDGE